MNMFGYSNLTETVKYIKRIRSRIQILKVNFKELKKAKTVGKKGSAFIQIYRRKVDNNSISIAVTIGTPTNEQLVVGKP